MNPNTHAGRMWTFYMSNDCSILSETFLVWFRVAWEIRLESYGPRQGSVIS